MIQIGKLQIGANRTFIIAEAGVNHDGRVETALRLVDAAVEAGADAVKFQVFRAQELASQAADCAQYQKRSAIEGTQNEGAQMDMLRSLELSFEEFARIKGHCDLRGIIFLATPFGTSDVDRVAKLKVSAIKIASTDLNNEFLVNRALAAQVPLILSTGAATIAEIESAIVRLKAQGAITRTIFLHCVSAYPARNEIMNLRAITALKELTQTPVGLSDHSESLDMGAWAVASGACVLEKHFTLDRKASGPDHFFSLDPTQLAEYIAKVRILEAAMGTGQIGYCEEEAEVRRLSRKSIVAARDVLRGEVLTDQHLTLKRPGTGISPEHLSAIAGRRAKADIPADSVLSWDLIE